MIGATIMAMAMRKRIPGRCMTLASRIGEGTRGMRVLMEGEWAMDIIVMGITVGTTGIITIITDMVGTVGTVGTLGTISIPMDVPRVPRTMAEGLKGSAKPQPTETGMDMRTRFTLMMEKAIRCEGP